MGVPSGGPGGVSRPTRRLERGRVALPVSRVWSEGPPGALGEVERPSWRAERGRESPQESREG